MIVALYVLFDTVGASQRAPAPQVGIYVNIRYKPA